MVAFENDNNGNNTHRVENMTRFHAKAKTICSRKFPPLL